MHDAHSTIYALSSHPGKSAVAVIRLSGPQTKNVLQTMVPFTSLLRPRHAHLARLVHPMDKTNVLDTCLCLWFPTPHSFTGEDMAEFHVHGGTAVIDSVLGALGQIRGLRMAERGEFSRRAFDNEKMDLTTLEGVADLINAETEAQRKLAVRQSRGELHQLYEGWRKTLIESMALTEAYIDFSEEENIEDGIYPQVCERVNMLVADIRRHLDDKRRGEILRNGVSLSIVGPPNSGKSTLLNKLAQRQVAIVSPIAGTTRDIVETTLDVGGYPIVVRDTAGLRKSSSDVIEIEGIRRAIESARDADARIFMLDVKQLDGLDSAGVLDGVADWKTLLELPHTFVVFNKADQMPDSLSGQSQRRQVELAREWMHAHGIRLSQARDHIVFLSCKTDDGWDSLMHELAEHIRRSWENSSSERSNKTQMPLTKARHRVHLQRCLDHLAEFQQINNIEDTETVVLAAEELRRAADALGAITGKVGIEDVLDALFGQFCIGK
ncbi:mitochondrial splicing system protein [Coemansia sp. RSA 1813]|nr:mitochondrial splicing system protein [Coemansia sp. RSA 1646]KAJ1769287.1 mitochondrial splicing system protein [Coemansia sp. RSA 1843]KAJ2088118.1 mitochondrial splicing system protein [Coemansia sp. RSA 986]KAJ2214842.1 mitochondrial splicing system protein [Coemansia sp. RSA 487]KAJ2567851.1 mitochondrial splicing system protein [Coemansia sp. RSA 1813]